MREIVTVDIGGTNVRFAPATLARGSVATLGEAVTFKTSDYPSLERAWAAFGERLGKPLPRAVAISFAGPVHGDTLKLTNNPWLIRKAEIASSLNVEQWTLVNDFGAVGHAVAHVGPEFLQHLCGPDVPLPTDGTISIVGPGTGLGVAHVLRYPGGYRVSETEGGHVDFSPLDTIEDQFITKLRGRFRRVSTERIVSGTGLRNVYDVLHMMAGGKETAYDDIALWKAAMDGTDPLAASALERFFLSLGSVAGDLVLAQGGAAAVIAGGLGFRLKDRLAGSGFQSRFVAKGRFEAMMSGIPVKILVHPQAGLLGAAAAFAVQYPE